LKVLIITYYWPPSGGSGVQRWLKFVKYLQDFDITPVVYTVDNPSYALLDKTLENEIPKNIEVLKQPIREPNTLLSLFKNKQKQVSSGFLSSKPSFFEKKMQYIRANYFIPDARKFWIKPSVKYLIEYLNQNPVDVIITTGPPHSMHLIGLELQEKLNIKWLADFRDPWTDIDYFHQLPLTKKAKEKHFSLEKEVLKKATGVLVVSNTMKEKYLKYNSKTHVITNGFDTFVEENTVHLDTKFTLAHIGMMNADRNPIVLWEALSELIVEKEGFAKDFQIKLIGKLAEEVKKSLQKERLTEYTEFINYLRHNEVLLHQKAAQVLLLAVNKVPAAKGIITGKIFEYLQAKRPILAIAPINGDLAEIIKNTKAGFVVDFEEKQKMKQVVLDLYLLYKENKLTISSENIEQYHRENLTKQLSEIIKNL